MDAQALGTAVGFGLVTGITVMTGITLMFLPASWVMNKFIYHSNGMRVILGLIAAAGSIISLAIILFGRVFGNFKKIHYFSLLPMYAGGPPSTLGDLLSFRANVVDVVTNPVRFEFNKDAIVDALQGFLVDTSGGPITVGTGTGVPKQIYAGAVDEEFFEAARAAAAMPIKETGKWKDAMTHLTNTGVGQALFG